MSDFNVEGMAISPNVVETIVSIAATEVKGVAAIGNNPPAGLFGSVFRAPVTKGVKIEADEDKKLHIAVHIDVNYGVVLPEIADQVRLNIADALATQAGISVASVDVFIDGMRFVA